jgi:predicted TIM-barrel fold metal-dependent hydrolase
MVVSKLGIEVIDAHAHFMTYDTLKKWVENGASLERIQQRVKFQTDMTQYGEFIIPEEGMDTGKLWLDELDKYGVAAIGMMISPETWNEFNNTRKRFPGRFMGYANVNPALDNAVDIVKNAGRDGFQGIKLYPSTWKFPVYDERVYPIYEEALKQKLLVILHFGITIGTEANLRFGNPLDIQRPAHDFPDLNFMIAHFGAGFFREVLMLFYQTHNVVVDSSGSNMWMKYLPYDLTLTKIFEKAIDAGGACRIAFGTDSSFFPRGFRYNILEAQYHAVKEACRKLDCPKEDIDLIFRGNILRFTGFESRE